MLYILDLRKPIRGVIDLLSCHCKASDVVRGYLAEVEDWVKLIPHTCVVHLCYNNKSQ